MSPSDELILRYAHVMFHNFDAVLCRIINLLWAQSAMPILRSDTKDLKGIVSRDGVSTEAFGV
jgi:hypothetical protein